MSWRILLWSVCVCLGLPLAGCNSDDPSTITNAIQATASVAGTVAGTSGGSQNVSVTFVSNNGQAITALSVSGLNTLPSGWSGPSTFSCGTVTTGSGCVLNLTYAPTASGSGTVSLTYSYTNSAGLAMSNTVTIPYTATDNDNVVATASPTGQINALVSGGTQSVTLTFTSDDGQAASALTLTSSLSSLPAGWSSAANSFACATLSTGNGCQLTLTFTPQVLGGGTLQLNYSYTNNAGTAKTGSANVAYAATTNDNVVATAAPSGQINAVASDGSQQVTLTFTTDDGQTATGLSVTGGLSSLPSGWSAPGTFSCSTVSTGTTCQLALTYAPQSAGSGTLTLTYGYTDNAGTAKTGSANIVYAATTDDSVSGTVSPSGQVDATINGSGTAVTVTFATNDGNPATSLSVTGGLSSLPSGWSGPGTFACSTVSDGTSCQLSLDYAPTASGNGTLTLNYGYDNDAGNAETGSVSIEYAAQPPHLYVVNFYSSTVDECTVGGTGALSSCAATPSGGGTAHATGIAFNGNTAYVTDFDDGDVRLCSVNGAGTLSNCTVAESGLTYPWALAINGNYLYITSGNTMGVTTYCQISAEGALSNCAATASGTNLVNGIAIGGGYAYLSALNSSETGYIVDECVVNSNGALTDCTSTGSGFSDPQFITLAGGYAYIGNQQSSSVAVCTIGSGGVLSSCANSSVGLEPNGIAINGSDAYVSDDDDNIYHCAVGVGTLSSCAVSDGGASFSAPQQLALH